jgi:hypothetical protein
LRRGRNVQHVVTLISADGRPFLRAVELWEASPGAEGACLALRAASEPVAEPATREAPGERLAAEVLASGVPKVVNVSVLEDAPVEGDEAPTLALGIPLSDGERMSSVVCLVF